MEAFGDLEESIVALDHDPAGVDAAPDGVSDEHAQHLCDPAPNRRRTDIPDSAVTKGSSYVVCGTDQVVQTYGSDQGREALRGRAGTPTSRGAAIPLSCPKDAGAAQSEVRGVQPDMRPATDSVSGSDQATALSPINP